MDGQCLLGLREVISLEHEHSFTLSSSHLLALTTGRLVCVELLKCECGRETINPINHGLRALDLGTEDTLTFLSDNGITERSLRDLETTQRLEMRKTVL